MLCAMIDKFRVRRGDAGLLLVDARVFLQFLEQKRSGDRGDFLAPVVGEGEEVGAVGIGMETGRVLFLGDTGDEVAVDADGAGGNHRPGLERIGHAQGEIEASTLRMASRLPQTHGANRRRRRTRSGS